ncbi:MAG: Flp family type IVb pilin [Planctomycetes bacterium]|nr:Flp family type IVb pilin [Planctomycetota bacterium]
MSDRVTARAELVRLVREESGPTATEYAILLAVLVLVAVAAIGGIGERIYNVYESVNSVMPG